MLTAAPAPPLQTQRTKSLSSSRFLIIGCGKEHHGDEAVGPQVARIVNHWALDSVRTLTISQLQPSHAADIASAEYVIFVAGCRGYRCARTVQLEPIVGQFQPLRVLSGQPQILNPWTLLNLGQQRYDTAPQAWLLQVPTERFDPCLGVGESLSATAQNGCDRALATITKFFQTYQDPAHLFRAPQHKRHPTYQSDLAQTELNCA